MSLHVACSSKDGEVAGGAGAKGEGGALGGDRGELVLENGTTVTQARWAGLSLQLDFSHGARIVSFALDDHEALLGAGTDDNFGSTFWTSPQSDWGWPPLENIDSAAYALDQLGAQQVSFVSMPAALAGASLQVTKRFSFHEAPAALIIDYEVRHVAGEAVSLAPWEVTRVPSGGLTFFPSGAFAETASGTAALDTTVTSGVTWFDHRAFVAGSNAKLNADGSQGWIAHATDSLLFVKVFADQPASQIAPGEGEVELFAAGSGSYVELENQGQYAALSPDGVRNYRVIWHLSARAESPQAGDMALVDAATTVADQLRELL